MSLWNVECTIQEKGIVFYCLVESKKNKFYQLDQALNFVHQYSVSFGSAISVINIDISVKDKITL